MLKLTNYTTLCNYSSLKFCVGLSLLTLGITAYPIPCHSLPSAKRVKPETTEVAVSNLLAQNTTQNVTSKLELLGNPSKVKYPNDSYSRNVWDLQSFKGKIYLGQGDAARNTGPAEIWSFNTSSDQFTKEFTTSEEMVHKFRVVDGQLVVPGADPRESWTMGNFYKVNSTSDRWEKFRNIPNAIHTGDLYKFQGRWYAGIGQSALSSTKASTDPTAKWVNVNSKYMGQVSTLFELNNRLFASGSSRYGIVEYKNNSFVRLSHQFLLGGSQYLNTRIVPLVIRPENFLNQLVYIVAKRDKTVTTPIQLNVATTPTSVRKVALPSGVVPWDVLVRGDKTYVLGSIYQAPNRYVVTVMESSNLQQWRESFRFQSTTFARSFELDEQGNFYFGLGTTSTPLATASGDILRLPRSAWSR